ncbi:DUF6233 domain-containing protein [Streptomyces sp. NPDC003781]|uniref:DUF6233 domain-containing protein n=1 Tax=Streptomyces sp. NPDC003781 TaxID=3364686 RepID=UPI0036A1A269
MTDLPPDLPRLRTLRTFLAVLLVEIDEAIARGEQREREEQRATRDRPKPPAWLLELGLNRNSPPVQVHQGDCWNSGKRTRGISLDEARRAITEGVKPCNVCRPDSALGFLDS